MSASLSERVYELRRDRRHGASWLARRAVEAVVETAQDDADSGEELLERLVGAGRELASARPEIGAVAGALGRLLGAASTNAHLPADELRRLVREEAGGLLAARDRAAAVIAVQLAERLRDASVLTHSASATVREALAHTPPERVVCTVSAPNEEGRWFAEELREAGLEVDLVDDDEALAALDHASLLLVGADTVFRDGSVCNKIGTCRLAEEATRREVPTVVAAEVIKLAPGDAVPLDEDAARFFDVTPARFVDEIATEEGCFRSDDVRPLVDRTPFLREGWNLIRG